MQTPQGPARDWYLAAEGAERAIRSITAAIEREGYEVLMDIRDASYSVRPREGCYVDEAEYAAASPAVQKAMRHFWRRSGELDAEKIKALQGDRTELHNALAVLLGCLAQPAKVAALRPQLDELVARTAPTAQP